MAPPPPFDVRYQTVVPADIDTTGKPGSGDYHGVRPGASTLTVTFNCFSILGSSALSCILRGIWQANRLGGNEVANGRTSRLRIRAVAGNMRAGMRPSSTDALFLGVQGLTETCVFVGPNGLMIFAASFGRLLSRLRHFVMHATATSIDLRPCLTSNRATTACRRRHPLIRIAEPARRLRFPRPVPESGGRRPSRDRRRGRCRRRPPR